MRYSSQQAAGSKQWQAVVLPAAGCWRLAKVL